MFFRKLRKWLLRQGKLTNYLFYALGEIFLVVIGILIALQINNANESQKDRKTENTILTQLKISLNDDIRSMNLIIDQYDEKLITTEWIISNYENEKIITDAIIDSIPHTMPWVNFPSNLAGYKQLESKGLDIVANDQLRNNIAYYYEHDVQWLEFSLRKFELDFNAINDIWLTSNYYAIKPNTLGGWLPNEREKLKKDPTLIGKVYNRRLFSNGMKLQTERTKLYVEKLIIQIDSVLTSS